MKLYIENARINYANGLWQARASVEGGKEKYSSDFLLMPDTKVYKVNADKSRTPISLKDAELAVANEAWKGNGANIIKSLEPSKRSIRNGDLKINKDGTPYPEYKGLAYIAAKNATRVPVFDRDRSPLTQADGKPYSGSRVNATIDLYAMTIPNKRGIFASLLGVQFAADDEEFAGGGGGVSDSDDFDAVNEPAGEAAGLF